MRSIIIQQFCDQLWIVLVAGSLTIKADKIWTHETFKERHTQAKLEEKD